MSPYARYLIWNAIGSLHQKIPEGIVDNGAIEWPMSYRNSLTQLLAPEPHHRLDSKATTSIIIIPHPSPPPPAQPHSIDRRLGRRDGSAVDHVSPLRRGSTDPFQGTRGREHGLLKLNTLEAMPLLTKKTRTTGWEKR